MLTTRDESLGQFESENGIVFGLQGWRPNEPQAVSITWFNDNTAMVLDQHGRPIHGILLDDGKIVKFATSAPIATEDGAVVLRPQFSSHADVVMALESEGIDWQAYTVRYKLSSGRGMMKPKMPKQKAVDLIERITKEGATSVSMHRTIACVGWPQLPYDELMKLVDCPIATEEGLELIPDVNLREDALRAFKELKGVVTA
jgi:hypothetical protein